MGTQGTRLGDLTAGIQSRKEGLGGCHAFVSYLLVCLFVLLLISCSDAVDLLFQAMGFYPSMSGF